MLPLKSELVDTNIILLCFFSFQPIPNAHACFHYFFKCIACLCYRWIESGEKSVTFRLASWFDQRAAQGDLKIATEHDTSFLAFVSNKDISNRKTFAKQLRHSTTDVEDLGFLKVIHDMVSKMNSPCLRLELLQYILRLDNRYSVAHVARSVELAATCLNISAYEAIHKDDNNDNKILTDQDVAS